MNPNTQPKGLMEIWQENPDFFRSSRNNLKLHQLIDLGELSSKTPLRASHEARKASKTHFLISAKNRDLKKNRRMRRATEITHNPHNTPQHQPNP